VHLIVMKAEAYLTPPDSQPADVVTLANLWLAGLQGQTLPLRRLKAHFVINRQVNVAP
jgi:hypothetical protein